LTPIAPPAGPSFPPVSLRLTLRRRGRLGMPLIGVAGRRGWGHERARRSGAGRVGRRARRGGFGGC
jgi:hypothetical protein